MKLLELIEVGKTRALTPDEQLELQNIFSGVADISLWERESWVLAVTKSNPERFRQVMLDLTKIIEHWDRVLLLEPGTSNALAFEKTYGITLEGLKPYAASLASLVEMMRVFASEFKKKKKIDEA
jgi:hypothetical protein